METIIFIFGLVLFVLLIVLHELGHAIVARRKGVVVEEFGIGFPPKAWGKKLKNGVLFTLNWLPIGGFVKLKGEHDSAKGKGTYGGASLWAKAQILMAGVAINWLTAVVIFSILAVVGMPKILPNQFTVAGDTKVESSEVIVGAVANDSAAQKAGLQAGDALLQIAGEEIESIEQLKEVNAKNAGKEVAITYGRGGQVNEAKTTLGSDANAPLGASLGQQVTQHSTWSAPIVGVGITAQFTYETFKGLGAAVGNLFTANFGKAGDSVGGPVAIVNALKMSSDAGMTPVLFLVGLISLALAVMNSLPIPALDGGRLFVTLLFRTFKWELTKDREEKIQAGGMLFLMGLVIVITVLDVKRIF